MAFTQRFLAPGTRLVVRPKTGDAVWHETKKEMIVADSPAHAICPMTGANVNWVVQDGFNVYFPDEVVRTREVLEDGDIDTDKLNALKPILFTYDIPDDAVEMVNGKPRPFNNPSDQLRRFAVRLNLSCWLMDAGDIPNMLIARMLDAGCDPHVFHFDATEGKKLVSVAISRLKKEIGDAIKRAERSRVSADAQLTGALDETGMNADEAEERYVRRANGIMERLEALTGDLNAAASRFGINPRVIALARLSVTGDALKSAMATRANAYAAAAKVLKATGTTTNVALANAAEVDQVPVGIMADALQDEGNEADAIQLRDAFAEPAETFSLVGVGTDDAAV